MAFNDLQTDLLPEYFTDGTQNVGYLLEGRFTSLYQNRFLPGGFDRSDFRESGEPSRIIFISDGDVIRNEFDLQSGQPLDLGVDPYAGVNYGNGELVTRLLDYLMDEDGLVMIRAKEIQIRPLDRVKVQEEKTKWQVINVLLPIVVIILFGGVKFYLRKRKFAN